jgi:putative ABC transport system permease protein
VDPVGNSIRMNDLPCKVIGVLSAKGSSVTGQDQDDFVLVPYTTAQKKLSGITWLKDIMCSATSAEAVPAASEQIVALLRERHRIRPGDTDDFNMRTPQDVIEAGLAAAKTFSLLLISVASVALLVGGIGIMNVMLVSVTERTREIGVRLAIGATEEQVRIQFLIEALVLSLFGGLCGVLLGSPAHSCLDTHWNGRSLFLQVRPRFQRFSRRGSEFFSNSIRQSKLHASTQSRHCDSRKNQL